MIFDEKPIMTEDHPLLWIEKLVQSGAPWDNDKTEVKHTAEHQDMKKIWNMPEGANLILPPAPSVEEGNRCYHLLLHLKYWKEKGGSVLNTRDDSLFTYKAAAWKTAAILDHKCIVIVTGFYEPHKVGKTSYPYLFSPRPASLAGPTRAIHGTAFAPRLRCGAPPSARRPPRAGPPPPP